MLLLVVLLFLKNIFRHPPKSSCRLHLTIFLSLTSTHDLCQKNKCTQPNAPRLIHVFSAVDPETAETTWRPLKGIRRRLWAQRLWGNIAWTGCNYLGTVTKVACPLCGLKHPRLLQARLIHLEQCHQWRRRAAEFAYAALITVQQQRGSLPMPTTDTAGPVHTRLPVGDGPAAASSEASSE